MKVSAYMVSGHGREKSEDRILACETILSKGCYEVHYANIPEGCFAIFDGVGGIAGGADASSYAAEQMRWYGGSVQPESLQTFLHQVGINLHNGPQNATTATGLYLEQGRALLFHVGNTRMYAMNGEFLERITEDQTTLAETFAEQVITQEIRNSYGHEITGCLGGMQPELTDRLWVRDVTEFFAEAKTILFTCDGIHDYVDAGMLGMMVKGEIGMEQIVELARKAGSDDDCTMMLLELERNRQ